MIYLQIIETQEEKDKFEAIYERYRGLMFSIANRILYNEHDAEDVVHQAFLVIMERIDEIEAPDSVRTKSLVALITERKAIDLYRRNKRHAIEQLNEETEGLSVEYDGGNIISECFLKLPVRYREILKLKYIHGYRIKEIAKIMGITEANAKKLNKRARQKLSDLCREEGLL